MKIWKIATNPIVRFSTLSDNDKNSVATFLASLTQWQQNMGSIDSEILLNEYIVLPQFFKKIIAYRGKLSELYRGEEMARYNVENNYTKHYSVISFTSQSGAGWFAKSKKEIINGSEIASYIGNCSTYVLSKWIYSGGNGDVINQYLEYCINRLCK